MPPESKGNTHNQITVLGCSQWAQKIREEISRCATYDSTVLISGPAGTGKEVVARSLHQHSGRASGPLILVDCTTISGPLFGSHLFGHRRGTFTGVDYDALGSFRAADGGTLFLDEIGELAPNFQSMLLRVLQERCVIPLGSYDSVPVDVRIVAATNRDLKRDVHSGRFREDLYFRLSVLTLETSSLKSRPEDIPILAEHFLEQLIKLGGFPRKRITAGALEQMSEYSWPGNARQLRHFLERALILARGESITLPIVQTLLNDPRMPYDGQVNFGIRPQESDAAGRHRSGERHHAAKADSGEPPRGAASGSPSAADRESSWKTLEKLEREHIRTTLEFTQFNQSAAARLLGVSRQALIRKIRLHQIELPPRRGK